jgi:acyl-CoA reductase-like NAD-dependent aldehyde dehydrogenase
VYVESAVAKAFIDKVVEGVKALRPGVDFGPLTSEARVQTVLSQVSAAKAAGARILVEGEAKGLFLSPIVVQVDNDDSPLMQEETFGPVIPIAVVADAEEAIRRANARGEDGASAPRRGGHHQQPRPHRRPSGRAVLRARRIGLRRQQLSTRAR